MTCAHIAAPTQPPRKIAIGIATLAGAQQSIDDPDSDADSCARLSSVVDHSSGSNAPLSPRVGNGFRRVAQERPDSIHPNDCCGHQKTGNTSTSACIPAVTQLADTNRAQARHSSFLPGSACQSFGGDKCPDHMVGRECSGRAVMRAIQIEPISPESPGANGRGGEMSGTAR